MTKKKKIACAVWAALVAATLIVLIPPVQNMLIHFILSVSNTRYEASRWQQRFHSFAIRPLIVLIIVPLYILHFPSHKADVDDEGEHNVFFILAVLFAACFCVLSFCTTSSFLYRYNTWDDPNTFLTMGKGLVLGKVPYRDLYDHKGPLLWFIHAAAYLLSRHTFHGGFIMEVLFATFFSYFAYKAVRLFTSKSVLFVFPLVGALIYAAYNISWGDTAEEFSIPFFMYALYVSAKHLKQKTDYSGQELFFTGVCCGCVLWIKYTCLGFFIGWIFVPLYVYIREKKFAALGMCILCFILGIIASALPYFIYFGWHHAIKDWFTVYFYHNMFLYTPSSEKLGLLAIIKNCIKPFPYLCHKIFFITLFTAMSFYFLWKENEKRLLAALCFSLLFSYFFVFFLNRQSPYSSFVLNIYVIFAIVPLNRFLSRVPENKRKYALAASFVFSAAFCLLTYREIGRMKIKREEMPQYQFREIAKTVPSPSLLTYKFADTGFYTLADILPSCKYFSETAMPLPEQDEVRDYYVQNAMTDFVITLHPLDLPRYELHAVLHDPYDDEDTYYVYKRQ
mgnify:CR=1 FL=1